MKQTEERDVKIESQEPLTRTLTLAELRDLIERMDRQKAAGSVGRPADLALVDDDI